MLKAHMHNSHKSLYLTVTRCATVRKTNQAYKTLRKIRCHYNDGEAFCEALNERNGLQVYSTDGFEPGEEVLLELSFSGLPGKMMIRAIGREWHAARPRLRVRAGGIVSCTGSEWNKLQFLKRVAVGEVSLQSRRRHIRLPVLVEVRWRRRDEREFTTSALSEISEGGALLLTREDLPLQDEIVIEITPPGSARPLEILAAIRNNSNSDGVGLEFMARDMGGIHRLREVIRRLIAQ